MRRLSLVATGFFACLLGCPSLDGIVASDAGPTCPGANLATDPKNCGACGHDCLGSTCTQGLCDPSLVSRSAIGDCGGSPVYVDQGQVYFECFTASFAFALYACARGNCDPPATIATGGAYHDLAFALVPPDAIAWASADINAGTSQIQIASRSGANPSPVARNIEDVTSLAADDQTLAWLHSDAPPEFEVSGTGSLHVCSLPDCASVRTIALNEPMRGLLIDSGHLYYATNEPNLFDLDLSGAADPFVLANENPNSIASDAQTLYFGARDGLMSLGKDGTGPTSLELGNTLHVNVITTGTVVDDSWLYLTLYNDNVVLRVPRGGGSSATIAQSTGGVGGMAMDEQAVYWADSDGVHWVAR